MNRVMTHAEFAKEFPATWRSLNGLIGYCVDPEELAVGVVGGYPFFVYDNGCYFEMSIRNKSKWKDLSPEQMDSTKYSGIYKEAHNEINKHQESK